MTGQPSVCANGSPRSVRLSSREIERQQGQKNFSVCIVLVSEDEAKDRLRFLPDESFETRMLLGRFGNLTKNSGKILVLIENDYCRLCVPPSQVS